MSGGRTCKAPSPPRNTTCRTYRDTLECQNVACQSYYSARDQSHAYSCGQSRECADGHKVRVRCCSDALKYNYNIPEGIKVTVCTTRLSGRPIVPGLRPSAREALTTGFTHGFCSRRQQSCRWAGAPSCWTKLFLDGWEEVWGHARLPFMTFIQDLFWPSQARSQDTNTTATGSFPDKLFSRMLQVTLSHPGWWIRGFKRD